MSKTDGIHGRGIGARTVIATIALGLLVVVAAPQPAEATARLWLYPDSDDPQAGGHIVTDPAFTLNIENRGTGSGDNTATETVLLVAVNDRERAPYGEVVTHGFTLDDVLQNLEQRRKR